MKLDKSDIIDMAFELLEEKGLDQFNLRALAARLSVSATALYWHFEDKGELIAAMAGRIYGQAYSAMEDQDNWVDCLRDFGLALRDSLEKYRDAARLCIMARPSRPDPQQSANAITRPLIAAGLAHETALFYEATVTSYVMGWTVFRQNPAMGAYLSAMFDYERSFIVGLDVLIKGFVADQHDRQHDRV